MTELSAASRYVLDPNLAELIGILGASTPIILLLSMAAGVYLWSKDHARRRRALRILRLLLGRRPEIRR